MTTAWPRVWTALDEWYSPEKWTLETAQAVGVAERRYDIWLHWHDHCVMIRDAGDESRNWCPLCPDSWGDIGWRYQVPPEGRPFHDISEAQSHLEALIRSRPRGRWLMSPQLEDELPIRSQTRLVRGVGHSALAHLMEQLHRQASDDLRVCGHLKENRTRSGEIFNRQWWAAGVDVEGPCPFCIMKVPAYQSGPNKNSGMQPGNPTVGIESDQALWDKVHDVHEHGVHPLHPEDIDCPDCRRVAEWRRDHGPKEPGPADRVVF
ncbi:MAG: hypothetical protein C7B45_17230 [Sulfobacillus acidophilus]|uniref:Uncharacterized protein n=1 Tax=Sulfobacillus acidophilus TaxID=53633 RepID=A0A2T2WCM3_9FIRM|nr:MAG: hypothetical protein C7B45_17230 [Sulfobacillus acidophilus]